MVLFVTSPNVRESKAVLDSEFHALDAGLQDPSLCQGKLDSVFQIVGGIPDSLSCILDFKAQDSGFHKQNFPRFRIPQAKISRIPESTFHNMRRVTYRELWCLCVALCYPLISFEYDKVFCHHEFPSRTRN